MPVAASIRPVVSRAPRPIGAARSCVPCAPFHLRLPRPGRLPFRRHPHGRFLLPNPDNVSPTVVVQCPHRDPQPPRSGRAASRTPWMCGVLASMPSFFRMPAISWIDRPRAVRNSMICLPAPRRRGAAPPAPPVGCASSWAGKRAHRRSVCTRSRGFERFPTHGQGALSRLRLSTRRRSVPGALAVVSAPGFRA